MYGGVYICQKKPMSPRTTERAPKREPPPGQASIRSRSSLAMIAVSCSHHRARHVFTRGGGRRGALAWLPLTQRAGLVVASEAGSMGRGLRLRVTHVVPIWVRRLPRVALLGSPLDRRPDEARVDEGAHEADVIFGEHAPAPRARMRA